MNAHDLEVEYGLAGFYVLAEPQSGPDHRARNSTLLQDPARRHGRTIHFVLQHGQIVLEFTLI